MIVTMLGRSYNPGYTGLGADDTLTQLLDFGKSVVGEVPDTIRAYKGVPETVPGAGESPSWFEENRELVATSAIVLGVVVVAGMIMKKRRR